MPLGNPGDNEEVQRAVNDWMARRKTGMPDAAIVKDEYVYRQPKGKNYQVKAPQDTDVRPTHISCRVEELVLVTFKVAFAIKAREEYFPFRPS